MTTQTIKFTCGLCGFITYVKEMPEQCPACSHRKTYKSEKEKLISEVKKAIEPLKHRTMLDYLLDDSAMMGKMFSFEEVRKLLKQYKRRLTKEHKNVILDFWNNEFDKRWDNVK